MMRLKGIYIVLIITCMLTISLTGCGSEKAKAEAEVTVTPAEAVVEETGDKDTGDFVEEEVPQTAIEDIEGEGMTDMTVPDLSGIEEMPVATPVIFTDEVGDDLFSLTVASIKGSDMAIENMGDAAGKKVVLVDYSFENTASEELMLFDDMSFKLVAGDTVATPYFAQDLIVAEAVTKGNNSNGQLAFIVEEDVKEVTLVFDNVGVNARALFQGIIE